MGIVALWNATIIQEVTYDSSKVKVTVKVTDDGKGKLSTSVTYDGGKKTFKNTFTPKKSQCHCR